MGTHDKPTADTQGFTLVGDATTAPPPAGDTLAGMNFSMFVISLSTQALTHLGEIPDPLSQQSQPDLTAAKQLIDILVILQEKTRGNLDQTEAEILQSAVYDLRLKYVERMKSR